jgi:hypothetical protein
MLSNGGFTRSPRSAVMCCAAHSDNGHSRRSTTMCLGCRDSRLPGCRRPSLPGAIPPPFALGTCRSDQKAGREAHHQMGEPLEAQGDGGSMRPAQHCGHHSHVATAGSRLTRHCRRAGSPGYHVTRAWKNNDIIRGISVLNGPGQGVLGGGRNGLGYERRIQIAAPGQVLCGAGIPVVPEDGRHDARSCWLESSMPVCAAELARLDRPQRKTAGPSCVLGYIPSATRQGR